MVHFLKYLYNVTWLFILSLVKMIFSGFNSSYMLEHLCTIGINTTFKLNAYCAKVFPQQYLCIGIHNRI